MDKGLQDDAFVRAVKAIASQKDTRFFLDWLFQARINALMDLSDAKSGDREKLAGAAQAYGDIIANVMQAMQIAGVQDTLGAALEGGAKFKIFARKKKNLFGKIKRFFRRSS